MAKRCCVILASLEQKKRECQLEYKGYAIDVSVESDVTCPVRFHAQYIVRKAGEVVVRGAVAGDLKTRNEAQRQAELAASMWIDDHS